MVKAIGAGSATITVESIEGNKIATCSVTVNKKVVSTRIKLDDVSKEASEFASYDLEKIYEEFSYIKLEYDSEGKIIPNKYYDFDGVGYKINDLGKEESSKRQEKEEQAKTMRLEIFNKLIDDKKSFIILIHTKECEGRAYSVLEGAEKILKQNNYSYFDVGTPVSDGDETLENSKLDTSKLNGGSVAIVKDGEIYASINPDLDAIKNDEETKDWLSKYIDIN